MLCPVPIHHCLAQGTVDVAVLAMEIMPTPTDHTPHDQSPSAFWLSELIHADIHPVPWLATLAHTLITTTHATELRHHSTEGTTSRNQATVAVAWNLSTT